MLSFQRGEINVESLQTISKQGILNKYKAELATQTYQKNLTNLNTLLKTFPSGYQPTLNRLQ